VLTLLATIGFARALAPGANDFVGEEPVRVMRFDDATQAALRSSLAWRTFTLGEGHGWTASFDEQTGTVYRAWGPGIPLDVSSADALLASVRSFLERNRDVLGGVEPADLVVRNVAPSGKPDGWLVSLARVVRPAGTHGPTVGFERFPIEPGVNPIGGRLPNDPPATTTWNAHAQGIPVWRGTVELRIVRGNLVMLGVGTNPAAATVDLEPRVSGAEAAAIAIAQGPAPLAQHAVWGGELEILPLDRSGALTYRLVWEVRTRTTAPQGLWVSFVDAQSGEMLSVHNEVRFVDGTILGLHDLRTVDGNMVVSPLETADVVGDTTVQTDSFGAFSVEGKAIETTLEGDWTRVRNDEAGEPDGLLAVFAGENTWTVPAATQAEIDSYVFLTAIHNWAVTYDIGGIETRSMESHVNVNDVCNAYFDGNVNFFRQGAGCNNAARVQDVNHHEWGHGFHYWNLEAGVFDGSISEAVADTIAFLQTHDSEIGPSFYMNGDSLRDVSRNRVYPDDLVGEVHYDGLIFGGTMWDLWGLLEESLGADAAYPVMIDLLVDGMKGGPDIAGSFPEFLVADDDDGDLGNGTPHECDIVGAFSAHGLTQNAFGTSLQLAAEPIASTQSPTLTSYAVSASVESLETCGIAPWDHVWTHYSVDGGNNWATVTMAIADAIATGAIPQQPIGTVVLYYFEGSDGAGGGGTVPGGADITPFSFVVGELTELYCEDFEADDGGYTHELLDGVDETLADDWQWGESLGTGGDPAQAFSGDNLWGNDIGGNNQNGQYQSMKTNRLTSIPIDVQGYSSVVVSFARWLSVEDGFYDQANVYADDALVWTNHASDANGGENTTDDRWMLENLVVETTGDTLELGWEIASDEGLEFGGWSIDDVCVYGLTVRTASDDTGATGDDTGAPSADGEKHGGCGCASGATPRQPIGWAMALGLLALARRRR
jgi:MYXO-CTERM domain-containing protein